MLFSLIVGTALAAAPEDFSSLLETQGTAMAPRVSTPLLLAQPENRELARLLTRIPKNPKLYSGQRIAIVVTDGVEEIELTATRKYFAERGARVHIISPEKPSYPAAFGVQIPEVRATHILTIRYMDFGGWVRFDRDVAKALPDDYDAVIIPGGAWNPDALRANADVLRFVRAIADSGKPTAAICHGPWVLGDAGLLRGKRATAWWWMKNDVIGAGATFVDEPAVVDGNLITSRAPGDLPAFLKAIGSQLLGRAVAAR